MIGNETCVHNYGYLFIFCKGFDIDSMFDCEIDSMLSQIFSFLNKPN